MNSKIMLSLATIALFVATAQATYTVETTNHWFSVVASTEDVNQASNTKWTGAAVSTESSLIKVDSAISSPAIYTPDSKPTATRYRVTGSMKVTLNAAEPGYDVFGATLPKAALVAVDDSGTGTWYAWHLTAADAGEWVEMSEHTPEEGETYAITIELTNTTVSYKVGSSQLLTKEGSSATLNTVGGQNIASVGLAGYGSFGDFGAVGYEEFEITVSESDHLTKYGITGEDIPAGLNAIGANGYPKWQSIVLGLKDSASRPYLAPIQNSDPDKITLALGGVNPAEGYTVEYAVDDVSTPTAQMGGELTYNNPDVSVVVTPGTSAVKYYRVKIRITK